MTDPHERIANIANRIMRAKVHFDIWDELRKCQSDENWVGLNRKYWTFMRYTIKAHYVSYVTELYSVMERRKDTINLHTLVESLLEPESPIDSAELEKQFLKTKEFWKK